MLKAFITIILAGLIVMTAGYVYSHLVTTDAFQTVHKMHAAPDPSARDPGGSWCGLAGAWP